MVSSWKNRIIWLILTLFIALYKMWKDQNWLEPTRNQSEPIRNPPETSQKSPRTHEEPTRIVWFHLIPGGFLMCSWWVLIGSWRVLISSGRFMLHHLQFILNQAQKIYQNTGHRVIIITNRGNSYHWNSRQLSLLSSGKYQKSKQLLHIGDLLMTN